MNTLFFGQVIKSDCFQYGGSRLQQDGFQFQA